MDGLQAGYNWQYSQTWLVGLEADFDWSKIPGTGTNPTFNLASFPTNFQTSDSIGWFGTVRGRLGFLPASNLLVFGTGGFAYGRIQENAALETEPPAAAFSATFSYDCAGNPNCFVGGTTRVQAGWTAGGGVEYALDSKMSVKAEYLYVNLGRGYPPDIIAQATVPGTGTVPSSFTANYGTIDFQLLRGGLNYKF